MQSLFFKKRSSSDKDKLVCDNKKAYEVFGCKPKHSNILKTIDDKKRYM
jgi:hypothetical protein